MFSASDQGLIEGLKERGWFASRSRTFQNDLIGAAIQRDFQPGEALYRVGDRGEGLYGILSGAVQVTVPADDGQEFTAHRDEAGFWIGDLASLSDGTRLVSVEATIPTRTLFVSNSRIEQMLDRQPLYWRDFYALTHENMQTALRILANLAVTRADRRLALRLLHLQEAVASTSGWIEISQDALASLVAVSVPTTQRALRGFADEALIELGYGRIRVLDSAALLERCQT